MYSTVSVEILLWARTVLYSRGSDRTEPEPQCLPSSSLKFNDGNKYWANNITKKCIITNCNRDHKAKEKDGIADKNSYKWGRKFPWVHAVRARARTVRSVCYRQKSFLEKSEECAKALSGKGLSKFEDQKEEQEAGMYKEMRQVVQIV